ncbi:hypothetical protein TNCV_4090021 [Trichonephila clavipes]|uniref:Uncharacterized protein n=1 Tax=Trichonephila clavipes TaxID=2585209 RepID=A0A8X6S906_TRICX|nr:hypothetical protein TNCV_4090021 [Trichonephila clavipes]
MPIVDCAFGDSLYNSVLYRAARRLMAESYTKAFGDGPHNFDYGQVTRTAPELALPLLSSTPLQREDI